MSARLDFTELKIDDILYRVAMECGPSVDIDDLRQEAYLAYLDACRRFRQGESDFASWARRWIWGRLKRVAYYSRRGSSDWFPHSWNSGGEDGDNGEEIEMVRDGADFWQVDRVRRAMLILSPEDRQLLEMRFYNQLKIADIAKALKVRSLGLVEYRLRRALRNLQQAWKQVRELERAPC